MQILPNELAEAGGEAVGQRAESIAILTECCNIKRG